MLISARLLEMRSIQNPRLAEDIVAAAIKDGSHYYLDDAAWDRIRERHLPAEKRPVVFATSKKREGPGAHLKRLLQKIGITATPNCSCNARAAMMDFRGPEWCEAHIDEIVGWLRDEAAKRGLPFIDAAGRLLVKRAIKSARKASSPGTQRLHY